MTSRSETPRTDAAAGKYRPGWQEKWEDMVACAASLETELTNWRRQATEWRDCATGLADKKEDAIDAYYALNGRYSPHDDPHDGRAFDAEERGEMPEEEA